MYNLAVWIIMAWQHISPEVTVEGFKKCCMSNTLGETHYDMLWYGSQEDGNVGVSVRKMKALTVKIETVTLIGKGR
jgi:hypothetical protein